MLLQRLSLPKLPERWTSALNKLTLRPSVVGVLARGADITASQSCLIKIDEYLFNPTFFLIKSIISSHFFSTLSFTDKFFFKFKFKLDRLIDLFLSYNFLILTTAPSARAHFATS